MAAMKHHDDVAQLLVDFGANVYAENKSGLRPSALVPSHVPLYQFLLHCESMCQIVIQFCVWLIQYLFIITLFLDYIKCISSLCALLQPIIP